MGTAASDWNAVESSGLSALSPNDCIFDDHESLISQDITSPPVDNDRSFRNIVLDGSLRFRHPAVQVI
jgi:hypothetical protein